MFWSKLQMFYELFLQIKEYTIKLVGSLHF